MPSGSADPDERPPADPDDRGGPRDDPSGDLVRRTLRAGGRTRQRPGPARAWLTRRSRSPTTGAGSRRSSWPGCGATASAADVVTACRPDADGVIVLDGLRAVAFGRRGGRGAAVRRSRRRRSSPARMAADGGVFVVVQDTGGDFGARHRRRRTGPGWAGWPRWPGRPRRSGRGRRSRRSTAPPPAVRSSVAEAIVAELVGGAGAAEVGLRADGTRVVPRLVEAPVAPGARHRIGPRLGGRGDRRGPRRHRGRAAVARARPQRPRLVLIGRTPLRRRARRACPRPPTRPA